MPSLLVLLAIASWPMVPVSADESGEGIVVTGTRERDIPVEDSAAPIQIIRKETLDATGQANLFDALKDVLPSLSATNDNLDTGALVRSARLKGLSPNETLVLVDGKRRHTTANVNADQGPDIASIAADLDLIPWSLIDHIEVLDDGAAAQYGSDAVAGVINIVLKHADQGTDAYLDGAITGRGDGTQAAGGVSASFGLGAGGYFDLSADYRHHDVSNRGGQDPRPGLTSATTPAFAVRARQIGDPYSDLANFGFNLAMPFGDTTSIYAFGTASHRNAYAFENIRPYNLAPTVYPSGFTPRETLDEVDFATTAGAKGEAGGWLWDLSATFGRDHDGLGVTHTVNLSPIPGTARQPYLYDSESVHAGDEVNGQLTTDLDFRRPFDVGLARPLNVAGGFEYRYETYDIGKGDPASYLLGGTQAYSGFTPVDATTLSRNVEAVYLDFSTRVTAAWQVDLAGRSENYDDVGATTTGKLTSRYDLSRWFAVRGTVSDGFHAPTLAQEGFSSTEIATANNLRYALGGAEDYDFHIPLNSPAARALGVPALKPEQSKEVSAGLVLQPLAGLHASIDAYQIFIDDRIISAPTFGGNPAASVTAAQLAADPNNTLVKTALGLNGFVVPAVPGNVADLNFFTNGADTRTRGLDVTAAYPTDFGAAGTVDWFLDGNLNHNSITRFLPLPARLAAAGLTYGGQPNVVNDLSKATPVAHVSFGGTWKVGDFDVTLRETFYGHTVEVSLTGIGYIWSEIPAAAITDLDIGYRLSDWLRVEIGANNLFNTYPPESPAYALVAATHGKATAYYPTYTPYGLDGATYFARLNARF